MKNKLEKYNTISLITTLWALNPDLSFVQVVSKAAKKAGYSEDRMIDCSDEDLQMGLEEIIPL